MAIQIRRGTNANWESNYSNIVEGEPAITMDSKRFFVGTSSGGFAEFANVGIVAEAFSSSNSYIAGELCTYQGKVYKCTTPHEGSWNASNFSEVDLDEGILSADDYLELASLIADEYDSTKTYFVGQFCTHDGYVYECKTAITTAESWNASHWNYIGSAS